MELGEFGWMGACGCQMDLGIYTEARDQKRKQETEQNSHRKCHLLTLTAPPRPHPPRQANASETNSWGLTKEGEAWG